MQRNISLITGIPRSGTTLCCHLINKSTQALALHEPVNPQRLTSSCRIDAIEELGEKIDDLDRAITLGLPFEHGDKSALTLDNPVSEKSDGGIRKVRAVRGLITLPPYPPDIALCIKQNALFTALLPDLTSRFPVIAIVRNPVDVLLSWMNVDLPVNTGHIPAGERYDNVLREDLQDTASVLQRQLYIYKWFTNRFIDAQIPVLRYEDIIHSHGKVLYQQLDLSPVAQNLNRKQRQFDDKDIATLQAQRDKLCLLSPFYTDEEISSALSP